jgi:dolichol-phosphate mannosyltransferase
MTKFLTPAPSASLQVPDRNFGSKGIGEPLNFSLVIPTYNESKNIETLISILSNLLDRLLPNNYELIVVDDDSPDRTWEVAQSLVPDYPQLRVMRREDERGLSTAVIRGWQIARGQILGVIDGDLQHPPEALLKMLEAIDQGADLVVASRHIEGGGVSDWGFIRRVLSRGAQLLGLIILPRVIGRVSDPMSGFFMLRRNTIADREMNPLGYKILIEVMGRGNIGEVAEVGYVFQERQAGASKVTWKQYVEYILHLLRLRSRGRLGRLKHRFDVPFRRFIQFGLVGLSGVFVDMAIFYLLRDPRSLGWGLTRSKVIAAELAIINNFLWNDRWTFGDISSQQKGWSKRIKRFIKFNLICSIGVLLNIGILNVLVNFFHINDYLANLMAIALVTIWNFWINLKLSWRVTQTN